MLAGVSHDELVRTDCDVSVALRLAKVEVELIATRDGQSVGEECAVDGDLDGVLAGAWRWTVNVIATVAVVFDLHWCKIACRRWFARHRRSHQIPTLCQWVFLVVPGNNG